MRIDANTLTFDTAKSYVLIISLSKYPILVGFRPTVLGSSICIIITFLTVRLQEINYDAETRAKNRGHKAH